MGRHWLFLTSLGFSIAGLIGLAVWWLFQRTRFGGRKWSSYPRQLLLRWLLGPNRKAGYELVNRHDHDV